MPFFDHYPYTNFHNVNLDWILERVKAWGQMVEDNNTRFENLQEANEAFKEYVTNYLQNLDIQAEIDDKLDRMFESGELTEYFQPYISADVSAWLDEHITEPTGVVIDTSLTISGACADALAVGDRFANFSGMSDTVKVALLACFQHVLWDDEHGVYYDALIASLYGEESRLTAIIDYGYATLFADDPLSKVKWMLKVYYDGEEVSPQNYTLTGDLVAGQSVLIITYNNETTAIAVRAHDAPLSRLTLTGGDLHTSGRYKLKENLDFVIIKATLEQDSTRKVYYTTEGHAPYLNTSNNFISGTYPIPIPAYATHVRVAVAPNEYMVGICYWRYNNSSKEYGTAVSTNDFTEHIAEMDIPQLANNARALGIQIRKPDNSAFDDLTEPTQVVVQFT